MGNPKNNEHEGLHAEMDYLWAAVDRDGVVEKAYPQDAPEFGFRRSVNIKETERVCIALGTNNWKPAIDLVTKMKREGFDLYEFQPSSHLQIVTTALGTMLFVASKRGITEAVELGVWYFRCLFKLCSLMDAGGNTGPWMPGSRPTVKAGKILANSEPRTACWQVAKGGKLPARLMGNRQFTGAIALSKLPKPLLASLTEDPGPFVLESELKIARRRDSPADYVAWFEEDAVLDKALAVPCRVAGVWGGVPFAEFALDAESQGRIAECGEPVIIPGAAR